jgi:hypothetical protein
VRWHTGTVAAAGAGLLVVVAAALAAARIGSRRGPRRLPSVESELATYGYDRYDDQRE